MTRWIGAAALALAAVAGVAGFAPQAQAQAADLTGAGGTFPYPIYQKWFYDYAQKTGVKINYQPIGSGGGIRQISEQTVDFGASDGPMTDQQLAQAKGGELMHIPTVLGAVAISYNVPGVPNGLKLTGPVLAEIYLGRITRWNDRQLQALNPGVKLPDTDILVTHRSEGSGTTYIFSDYLSTQSPAWKAGPGKGTDIQWPVGLGGKGNAGVAGLIKQTPGSIGYVELAYVLQNKLPYALLRNAAGRWIAPSMEGATAAAAGVAKGLPASTDFRVSIVNAPGAAAYPISSFTWLLVYKHLADASKQKKLLDFIRWALHDGQKEVASLDYAALPPNVVRMLDQRLAGVVAAR